jgi:hypothetical protein
LNNLSLLKRLEHGIASHFHLLLSLFGGKNGANIYSAHQWLLIVLPWNLTSKQLLRYSLYPLPILSPDSQNNYLNITLQDLTELTPPQIAYQKWCPNPRLGWNAPSLQAVMKRKATDPLDDQPIISLVQKGAGSSKRAVKKVRVSKPQPKDIPTPGADENQLKSLADAAITEVLLFRSLSS